MEQSKAAFWVRGDSGVAILGSRGESILFLRAAEFGRTVTYPGSLN